MMVKKMTLLGIGPKITIISCSYFIVASLLTLFYPEIFILKIVPYSFFIVTGSFLLTIGIPILIIAGLAVSRGFKKGELVTSGVFSFSRNPLYAAWILFLIPGVMMFFRSWLMLGTSLAAYGAFKIFIGEEYEYLRRTFGEAYDRYESSVNELIPLPVFRNHKFMKKNP